MKPPKNKIVWHYTNGLMIDEIIKSGVIQVATAGIGVREQPAAWFSTNPVWDASANRGNVAFGGESHKRGQDVEQGKPVMMSTADLEVTQFDPQMMEEAFKGRFRIGVAAEAAPQGWESFKRLSGIDKEVARSMETTVGFGNPKEWRASFQPVGRKYWRTIERLVDGVWVTYVELSPSKGNLSKRSA